MAASELSYRELLVGKQSSVHIGLGFWQWSSFLSS